MYQILDIVIVYLILFELCYGIELCVYDDVTIFVQTMLSICIKICTL
jgi:hypothetical protein